MAKFINGSSSGEIEVYPPDFVIEAFGSSDVAGALYIRTDGVDRLVVTPEGLVGINLSVPSDELHVNGTIRALRLIVDQIDNSVTHLGDVTSATLDFDGSRFYTVTLVSGTTTLSIQALNYREGATTSLRVKNGSSTRNLAFTPQWSFVGAKPTNIAANKIGVFTLTCLGITASDCVAAWAVQT